MRLSKLLVPALCLSVALLAGCAQTTPGGADAQTDRTPVQDVMDGGTAEPEQSNWQQPAFYERSFSEVTSDLDLLGFELVDEYYDEENAYLSVAFRGTPAGVTLEGSDGTVTVNLYASEPTFSDDAGEPSAETLADGVAPNGFDVFLYVPDADPSEYEGIARQAADAAGLGEFTDSYVGEAPFTEGQQVGNFTTETTFNGEAAGCLFVVQRYEDPSVAPNPDAPLVVSYGCYM